MRVLQRYIRNTIIHTTLIVTLLFIGLDFFIIFLSQLDDIGHADYGIYEALIYSLGVLPLQAYSLFPLAALLGCLIGLGSLSANSELIIMRSSGISIRQIIIAVLKPTLLLVFVVTFIGELFGPISAQFAETTKAVAESGGYALKTKKGIWLRNKDQFIRVSKVISSRTLSDVISYQMTPERELKTASIAKKAVYRDHHWTLYDVKQSIVTLNGVMIKHFKVLPWNVTLDPKMFGVDLFEPGQLSLDGLKKLIAYQKKNGLEVTHYQLSFWQRVLQPFATAVMIFLAIPFIFGPLRTVTMGLRILIGVAVGFSFYLLNQFFGPLTLVFQLPPLITAAFPPVLFLLIGCLMLRKAR